ncbi:MAG: hypothetical protein AAGB24_15995 [Bacteroidota bacterium]
MPNHRKTKKGYAAKKRSCDEIIGLDAFRKKLEKEFFSETTIDCAPNTYGSSTDLIVRLHCNFGLTESLFQLNNGNWGGFQSDNRHLSPFEKSIRELNAKNDVPIDIMEFTIHFKDTSLVIAKIYPQSIIQRLGTILVTISENFVYFTKGLTEMPFEIFIPVFMEEGITSSANMLEIGKGKNKQRGYLDYWGLYFDSDINEDASIYDVKKKGIIKGDFFLLNY